MKSGATVTVVKSCDVAGALDTAIAKFLNDAARHVHSIVVPRAPVDMGFLSSALSFWPPAEPGAREISVGVPQSASGAKGASIREYGGYLDTREDTHYRGTQRQGEPTKGWFSDGVAQAEPDIQRLAQAIGADVKVAWERAS